MSTQTNPKGESQGSAAQLKMLMKCCTVVGGFIFKAATKAMNDSKKQQKQEQQPEQNQQQQQQQQQQHIVEMSPAPAAQEPMPTRPNANFMPSATQQPYATHQQPMSGSTSAAQPQPSTYAPPQGSMPVPWQTAPSPQPVQTTTTDASMPVPWQNSPSPQPVQTTSAQQSVWEGPAVTAEPVTQQPAWGEAVNAEVLKAPTPQQPAWGGASNPDTVMNAAPATQQPAWGGAPSPEVMAAPAPQQSAWGSTPNTAVMTPSPSGSPATTTTTTTTTTNAGATTNVDVDLATAMSTLWTLDSNRLNPGVDYQLDIQGYTKFHGDQDYAHDPLFAHVDNSVLTRPTYATFIALLDNYEAETGKAERTTAHQANEQDAFLDAIMQTAPMQFCHRYLAKGGHAPTSVEAFKSKLKTMWFREYKSTSGGPKDSSGFEHVFVGEVKNGDKDGDGEDEEEDAVTGMHNWVQLWREEVAHRLDYRGYISHGRGTPTPDQQDHILTLQFAWNGTTKRISTSFVGVSPEFEIALYTLLALAPMDRTVTRKERGKDVTTADFEGRLVELNVIMWEPSVRTAFPVEPR